MYIDLQNGINQRLGAWRGQLWQIFEAQSGPISPHAIPKLLRTMVACVHQAGLDNISQEISALAAAIARNGQLDRSSIESWADRIFLNIEQALEKPVENSHSFRCLISVFPGPDFFSSSIDISLVFRELAKLGELHIIPALDRLPPFKDLETTSCKLGWHLILDSRRDFEQVHDTLSYLESEPGMEINIEHTVSDSMVAALQSAIKFQNQPPSPQKVVETSAIVPPPVKSPKAVTLTNPPEQAAHAEVSTIRLTAERLDRIIDAVGELVTAQVRLSRIAEGHSDQDLATVAEEIERLTIDLRDGSMGLRMISVKTLFQRFSRLVRDLSQTLGKEVDFVTEGEDTELDRTVIEKLYDPLVHLVRNSMDHGLESPAVRLSLGKNPRGKLCLRAAQQGPEVIIQVIDDGAGINVQKVRAKALERGLIREDSVLSERESQELIFLPGFSTADSVSGVSGRGVGMDVVKTNVETLRGHVEIDSLAGQSCTMTLRFPLTMAIIDGLCVMVDGEQFILPIDPIEECLYLDRYEDGGLLAADFDAGKDLLKYNLRGKALPICSLSSVLKPGAPKGHKIIVLRSQNNEKMALTVDSIVGRQQVVVKPIGPLHNSRRELSGATIMGDGSMALILDVPTIIRRLSGQTVKVMSN